MDESFIAVWKKHTGIIHALIFNTIAKYSKGISHLITNVGMGEMLPFLSLFLSNTVNKKKAGAL